MRFLNSYCTLIRTEWQSRDYWRRKEEQNFDLLLPGNLQVQWLNDDKAGHIFATSHYTLLEQTLFTSIYTSPIIIYFSITKHPPISTQILNLFPFLLTQEKNNSPFRTRCFKLIYFFQPCDKFHKKYSSKFWILIVVMLKITFCWDVRLYRKASSSFRFEKSWRYLTPCSLV
jgi:hypothetical protein